MPSAMYTTKRVTATGVMNGNIRDSLRCQDPCFLIRN